MDIIIRNTGETPIYDQITRQVKTLILTGVQIGRASCRERV